MILNSNTELRNQYFNRSEIKEETGEWEYPAELYDDLISEGGEALVFSQKFDNLETAVRVHIFDPFLFTDFFGLESLSWNIHLEKGWSFQ